MNHLIQQIIDQIIKKKALITNYPKPGVTFLALDSLFNDPISRKLITDAVISAIGKQSFDGVAGIASRGYLFSGIIANHFTEKGESLIQKAKVKGDTHYVQIDTKTEYSTDTLQVLKNTIKKGQKYLLTDDLIATGGSVLTAVQLIRECGGEVDTVFVMTELLGFDAREQLKKAGIELIGLLPFTNHDLQKIVLMQKCYEAAPTTSISYALSNQIKGKHEAVLNLHVASLSPLKLAAAELAVQGMLDPLAIQVIGHDAPSNVSSQPYGYEETIKGASNRMDALTDGVMNDDHTVLVSIENGIRYAKEENAYYDFAHVMVRQGEQTFSHTQDCCNIPVEIINAIAKDATGCFKESWGEAAKRMGLAKDSNNPHLEACFGGISRSEHLFKATCKALATLKDTMAASNNIEENQVNINRMVMVNSSRSKDKYAKQGVLFFAQKKLIPRKSIDIYNHGCPVQHWNIDADVVKRNDFKIFATGDAFSVISADVEVDQANINIHVGIKHDSYSPSALLQEALQLCRCAYEHGAREITVTLPEQFHPVLHADDFNLLLMSLFKASGANRIYYYDESYKGKLDESNINAIAKLNIINNNQANNHSLSLDDQVMQLTRKKNFEQAWFKSGGSQAVLSDVIHKNSIPSNINIPESDTKPHILLCCSANKPLAEKIAENLREQGEIVMLYQIVGQGEHASIPHEARICGAVVTIVQSTRPSPDNVETAKEYQINGASRYLFEAAMIARQAQLRGADKINLINPYQFSARSDKAEDNPKGRAGAYVQQNGMLFKAAGVNQVISAECHDCHTMSGSYTGKNIKGSAVSALSFIATKLASEWLDDPVHPLQGQLRLVTPDAGATKRTNQLTEQLQVILGKKLCQSRVSGEKQRNSHKDDSALIKSLNTGNIDINPNDKFIITDDETATGNTLCQAITSIKNKGAKDISVIIVHNNMPLDWLLRQLCLARFLYLGVNDLHFSDTQEMGTLAKSYDDLIDTYSQKQLLTKLEVEIQVYKWFIKNITQDFQDKTDTHLNAEFSNFKNIINLFQSKVKVHSLAKEFAHHVRTNYESHVDFSLSSSDSKGLYTSNSGTLLLFPTNRPHTQPSKSVSYVSGNVDIRSSGAGK